MSAGYCKFQPGSLRPEFLKVGAVLTASEFPEPQLP